MNIMEASIQIQFSTSDYDNAVEALNAVVELIEGSHELVEDVEIERYPTRGD